MPAPLVVPGPRDAGRALLHDPGGHEHAQRLRRADAGPRVRVLAHLIRLPEQTHLWVTRVENAPQDPSTAPAELAHRISTEFLGKLRPSL